MLLEELERAEATIKTMSWLTLGLSAFSLVIGLILGVVCGIGIGAEHERAVHSAICH